MSEYSPTETQQEQLKQRLIADISKALSQFKDAGLMPPMTVDVRMVDVSTMRDRAPQYILSDVRLYWNV